MKYVPLALLNKKVKEFLKNVERFGFYTTLNFCMEYREKIRHKIDISGRFSPFMSQGLHNCRGSYNLASLTAVKAMFCK